MYRWMLYCLIGMLCCSCRSEDTSDTFGPILVQIDNKKLHTSEIDKLIHEKVSPYDSAAIANAYIDSWIKDQLLILEAQKFLSSDFEIEALVEDYRNQLIGYKYEQSIIEQNLNTNIQNDELLQYYEEHKADYLLIEPIYKVIFASIPYDTKKIDRFYSAWVNDDFPFIQEYCSENADTSYLEKDIWIDEVRLIELVPAKLIENRKLTVDRTIQRNLKGKEYFLKILDLKAAKDTIPLELIKEKIEKVIIHERKQEVIDNYKKDLYEKAMRSNTIKLKID